MARRIKINVEDAQNVEGELVQPVFDKEHDLHIWYSAECEVTVYLTFEEIVLPLFTGTSLDQTYIIPDGASEVRLVPHEDKGLICYRFIGHDTRRYGVTDPIPTTPIVPIDDNSLQMRVMRAVELQLEGLGLKQPAGRGQNYRGHTDEYDDDDPEMGPGYQYDPEVDEEITAAAVTAVRDKLLRGKSTEPPAGNVPDDQPETPGGTNPPAPKFDPHTGKPLSPGKTSSS